MWQAFLQSLAREKQEEFYALAAATRASQSPNDGGLGVKIQQSLLRATGKSDIESQGGNYMATIRATCGSLLNFSLKINKI